MYLVRNSLHNKSIPVKNKCQPKTRVTTRPKRGAFFWAALCATSLSHSAHSRSPSESAQKLVFSVMSARFVFKLSFLTAQFETILTYHLRKCLTSSKTLSIVAINIDILIIVACHLPDLCSLRGLYKSDCSSVFLRPLNNTGNTKLCHDCKDKKT